MKRLREERENGGHTVKYFFRTFGCRVNQCESERLRAGLAAAGARGTEDFESADVCLVNTCTVTTEADREALALLRRIARRNPAARLIVTGCLAARDAALVRQAAPQAEIVGNEGKAGIPALLGCSPSPKGGAAPASRSRAFLKVQDGCDMGCAFCVIPSIRPRLAAKPFAELKAEARGLIEAGYPELVLCGIRLGRYLSQDDSGLRVDLCGAIERLLALPGRFRLRLSSLEITDATDRLFALMANSGGKFCPSLHVPLQSGSATVLRRMRRWYSPDFYRRRVASYRAAVARASLFADVMTGFPGESEEEHQESLHFARSIGFQGLHVFRYSRRPSTVAARLPALPEGVVLRRARQWRALDAELRATFAARAVGQCRLVVPELSGQDALAEDFLTVHLEHPLGPGFASVVVTRAEKAQAVAKVL